jgi:signal transduction histidine kinase
MYKFFLLILLYFFNCNYDLGLESYPDFLNSNQIVSIATNWKYTINPIHETDLFEENGIIWKPINVPGYWVSNGLVKQNVVYYKNEFILDSSLKDKQMSILLKNVLNCHELYVNGKIIGSLGKMENQTVIEKNARPILYFIPKSAILYDSKNTIILKVGDDSAGGGILDPPLLCEVDVCEKEFQVQIMFFGGGFIFLLFMSIFYLLSYFGNYHEKSYLYFSLLSFLFSLLIVGYQRYTYIITSSYLFHYFIFHPSIFLSGFLLILLIYNYFYYKLDLLGIFVLVVYFIIFVISLIAGFNQIIKIFYNEYIINNFIVFLKLLLAFSVSRVLFRAWKEKLKGILWVTVGSLVLFFSIFNLIFYYSNTVNANFLNQSIIIFISCYAIAFSIKNKNYYEKLIEMEVQQNEQLEKMVQSKTIELVETNNELVKSDQIKNRLFSILAHDLRAPLNSLEETLGLFKSKQISQGSLDKYIKKVNTLLDNNRFLLENILHWSINQMEHATMKMELVNPRVIIMESFALHERMANQKKIKIRIQSIDGILCKADKNALRFIIRNLLSNAIKFSYPKSVISFEITEDTDNCKIAVIDQGKGMDDLVIENLFTYQREKTELGTNKEIGNGIGLYISYEYIQKMGGNILVESKLGEGSRFTLVIPK